MKAGDEATFAALVAGFRAGIPSAHANGAAEAAAASVFGILAAEGGPALVGRARELAPGTFWAGAGRQ